MQALKLAMTGCCVGVILPRETPARRGLAKGDVLYAIDQPDGVRLTTADPVLAAQMVAAQEIVTERRAVLRGLSL